MSHVLQQGQIEALAGLGGPWAVSAFLVLPPSPALDDAEHPKSTAVDGALTPLAV